VEAPSDNSTRQNSESSSPHTSAGVIVDIGTGDGRFVYRSAQQNPNRFYIGIDASAAALKEISTKATRRKQAKGGLNNVLFLQAAIENLPEELDEVADEIHVHFPWGSLLQAVATGADDALKNLRRIAAPDCLLEIIIGLDETRDRTEIERLSLPQLSAPYLQNVLLPKYRAAGFETIESGVLSPADWTRLETSWARKLQVNAGSRKVIYLIAQATSVKIS
jgi:16S rRNA (adenine(1408)-N(1))-methyltransferase